MTAVSIATVSGATTINGIPVEWFVSALSGRTVVKVMCDLCPLVRSIAHAGEIEPTARGLIAEMASHPRPKTKSRKPSAERLL